MSTTKSVISISPAEAKRLTHLEHVIDSARDAFEQVAKALAEIKERKLYRGTHNNFQEYCRERFGWAKSYGYHMAKAGEVLKSLPENSTIVENESQARELAKVPKKRRLRLVRKAAKRGKVTAKAIRNVATKRDRHEPKGEDDVPEVVPDLDEAWKKSSDQECIDFVVSVLTSHRRKFRVTDASALDAAVQRDALTQWRKLRVTEASPEPSKEDDTEDETAGDFE